MAVAAVAAVVVILSLDCVSAAVVAVAATTVSDRSEFILPPLGDEDDGVVVVPARVVGRCSRRLATAADDS